MNNHRKTFFYSIVLFLTVITISKAEIFTVTNTNSSGAGSLMQTVTDANNTTGADTIIFDINVRGTIDNNGTLTPEESLTIIGPGPDLLTITSGGSGRVIKINYAYGNSFTFTGLTISGGYNASGAGAGIFASAEELIIKNCIIKDNVNSYPNTGGGGIYAISTMVYIENSLIQNNSSYLGGAGMSLAASSITVVKNSSIIDNTVVSSIPDEGGGGIYVSGILSMENCTISGNSHPIRGGAINVYGFLNLNSCTVTDNSADECGGIYEDSPSQEDTIVVLENSLIGLNASLVGGGNDLHGRIYSRGYNLIYDYADATISGDVTGNILGQYPLLGPLENYSSTVMFHPLLNGSPAIDNANNETCLSTDQRGIYRPQDGDENGNAVADIGSIELLIDADDDGISDLEEQGPNGNDPTYDGNLDGFADKDQSNVASFWNYNNEFYLTIAAPGGYKLIDVKAIDNPSPENAPNVEFPVGFFSFIIDLQGITDPVVVRMYLPQGVIVTDYYKYGQTPVLPLPHWYQFMYDSQTGAEIIQPNIVDLHFIDGDRGDNDITVNGFIVEPGGPVGYVSAVEDDGTIPLQFNLEQNYPNPFNPTTKIEFRTANFGFVSLKVYDILGNEVAILVNEEKPAGSYEVEFNGHSDEGQNLSSGIYFYQLKSGSFIQTKKMILIK
jgi:hypothetical protein